MRVILFITMICFIVSCSSKAAVKQEVVESPAIEPVLQEIKQLEPPPLQKPPEPKETKKQDPIRIEKEADEKFVILNFDDADIRTVISAVGGMLNINYVIAPGVTGKVTIQSYKKFPVKDVFQIFQTILEVNGLTAVKDGEVYRIVPIDSAKQQPLSVASGKELKLQLDSSFLTQIVPLQYVKASDIVNILRNLTPRGADFVVYEPSNLLIVTSPPASLVKFMKIIEAIDILSTERESLRTFVYNVENGEAKKLADILKSLYEKKGSSVKTVYTPPKSGSVAPSAPGFPTTPSAVQSKPITPSNVEGLISDVEGDIVILAYEDINALIIKTSPRNYLSMLETLKKLDVSSRQVLIEVLIAEVTLNDTTQFGIEWLLKAPLAVEGTHVPILSGFTSSTPSITPKIDSSSGVVTNIVANPSAGTAFAAVINPVKYGVILNAFASIGKLNVLSSPHILAMDNKEAKIEIGDEIPIATGFQQQPSTSTTTGTTSFVAAGQIQYRTTGIILSVTPHISEKGRVTLKISQEISNKGVDISLAGITSPSFTTRKAQTTGVVQSGHTLVIGGLISEQKNKTREGIPLLSSIPLLGYLFGTTKDVLKKTELLIMVTPHVVTSVEEADALTKEFQNRVKTIKERLKDVEEKREKEKKKEEDKEEK